MRLIVWLDLAAMAAAFVASWLWYRASGTRLRRVSRREDLDAGDINRIVTAINRTQILNMQAALATAVAAGIAAIRFAFSAWID